MVFVHSAAWTKEKGELVVFFVVYLSGVIPQLYSLTGFAFRSIGGLCLNFMLNCSLR
jgi:hypothetical protein